MPLLTACSWLYAGAVKNVLRCYERGLLKKERLSKPVISVGNVTWGGVGKTPLVCWIAEYLKGRDLKPAILTRGYMAESGCISDESQMLKQVLGDVPVGVGSNRIKSAGRILKEYPADAFILDDGFQHWRLLRDLDVVVIDSTNPFGNGHLIPRGILREPLKALLRAGCFVLTKTDLGQGNIETIKTRLYKINPQVPVVETIHQAVNLVSVSHPGETRDLQFLKGRKIGAFAAIGDPGSFEKTLDSLGAAVTFFSPFRDHHQYSENDLRAVMQLARKNSVATLVTTQKDEAQLLPFLESWPQGFSIFSLRIRIAITKNRDEFTHRISALF